MAENLRDFAPHFFFRRVRMLRTEPRRFHLSRRPAKLFRQRQTAFGRHPAVNRELFGTGLLIRQHGKIMRQKNSSRKRGRATANTCAMFNRSPEKTKAGTPQEPLAHLQGHGDPK